MDRRNYYGFAGVFGGNRHRFVKEMQYKRSAPRNNYNSSKQSGVNFKSSKNSYATKRISAKRRGQSSVSNKSDPSSKSKPNKSDHRNESCNVTKAVEVKRHSNSPPSKKPRTCENNIPDNVDASNKFDNSSFLPKRQTVIEYPVDYIPKSYEDYLCKHRDRKHRRLRLHQLSDYSSSSDSSDDESHSITNLSVRSRSPISAKKSTKIVSPYSSPYGCEPSNIELPPEFASCLSPLISPRLYNRTPSPNCEKPVKHIPNASDSSSEEEHFSDHEFHSYLDLQDECNWTPPHILEDRQPHRLFYALPNLTISQQPLTLKTACAPDSSNGKGKSNDAIRSRASVSPPRPVSVSSDGIRPLFGPLRRPIVPPTEYQHYKNNYLPQNNSPHSYMCSPEISNTTDMEICSPQSPVFVEGLNQVPNPNNNLICNKLHLQSSSNSPSPPPPPPPSSPPAPAPPPPSFTPPLERFDASNSTCPQKTFTNAEYNKVNSPPSPEISPNLKLNESGSPPSPKSSPEFNFPVNKSLYKQQNVNFVPQNVEMSVPTSTYVGPNDSCKIISLESCNNEEQNYLDCDIVLPSNFHQYHSFLSNPSEDFQKAIQSFQTSLQRHDNDSPPAPPLPPSSPSPPPPPPSPPDEPHIRIEASNSTRTTFTVVDYNKVNSPPSPVSSPDLNLNNNESGCDEFLPPVNKYQSFLNDCHIFQNVYQLLHTSAQNDEQANNKSLSDEEWQDSDLNDKPKPNEAPTPETPCTNTWQHMYLNNEAKNAKNSILASLRLSAEYENKQYQNFNKKLYDKEWLENNIPFETPVSNSQSFCEWQDSDIKNVSMQNTQNNCIETLLTPQSNAMSVDDYMTCLKLTPPVHVNIPEDDFC